MTQVKSLKVVSRATGGKGPARQTRRAGNVPAVIYGDNKTPTLIALDKNLLVREVEAPGFFTRLYDLELDGQKHRVLPRDVQLDPVTDVPVHADFLRVSAKTTIRVEVPLFFTAQEKAPGIKRGGVLNVVSHTLEVSCLADNIPERIEISVEGMEIGDGIHLKDLKLPQGAKPVHVDEDLTIATIAAPSAVRSEAKEAAEAAAAAAAAAEAAAAPAAGAAPGAAPAAGAAAPAAGDKKEAAPAKK